MSRICYDVKVLQSAFQTWYVTELRYEVLLHTCTPLKYVNKDTYPLASKLELLYNLRNYLRLLSASGLTCAIRNI